MDKKKTSHYSKNTNWHSPNSPRLGKMSRWRKIIHYLHGIIFNSEAHIKTSTKRIHSNTVVIKHTAKAIVWQMCVYDINKNYRIQVKKLGDKKFDQKSSEMNVSRVLQ